MNFLYVQLSQEILMMIAHTAKNTVISPNFLVWKFCGKVQFSHSLRANCAKLCGNCAFRQNFYIRKLGEITVFFAVSRWWKNDIADLTGREIDSPTLSAGCKQMIDKATHVVNNSMSCINL